MYIKERHNDLPFLEKGKLKRIQVSIKTWESVCDRVESIIKDGQVACKKRWFTFENILGFLDLPSLDPIDEGMPLKLNLEHIESDFTKAKDHIMGISQLHLNEIKEWIEDPLTSQMSIGLFL